MEKIRGVRYYTSRAEAAAGYGVSLNTMKGYLRRGKIRRIRVGASGTLIPVGQHGEDKLPGWPDVPQQTRAGPKRKADRVVPYGPYPTNRKSRAKRLA